MSKAASICALHGFTGGGADFAGFSSLSLPDSFWLCPDLPGHGGAAVHSCDAEAAIKTIEEEYTTARDNYPSTLKILLGYSMGGRAALLHACAFPKKWDALVLISTNPGIEAQSERTLRLKEDRKLASEIMQLGSQHFIRKWQEHPLISSQKTIRPDWHASLQQTRGKHTADGLAASLLQFGQGTTPNQWPQLKQLNIPVLLLSGSLDKKYRTIAERMETILPKSKHHCINDAGHMPHLEQPELTAKVLRNFVNKL